MMIQRAYMPRLKHSKCPSCLKNGLSKVTCFDNVYSRSCKFCDHKETMGSAEMTQKIRIMKFLK